MIQAPEKVAKYQKIRKQLQASIENGEFKIGSQLPSQNDLSEQFGASLLTVRQALNLLERSGLIVRIHGRGTFVERATSTESVGAPTSSIAYVRVEGNRLPSSYEQVELRVLDELLAERGEHLVLATLKVADIVEGRLPPGLQGSGVKGILLEHDVQDVHLAFLKRHGIPLIVIGSYPLSIPAPTLMYNQAQAAYLMCKALLEARPRQKLYFLTEPFHLHFTHELTEGYNRACLEGGQIPHLRVVFEDRDKPDLEVRRIIEEREGTPFSLFVNANIAHGIVEAYRDCGLTLVDCPAGIYGAADYVSPEDKLALNQCTLDVPRGTKLALQLLGDVIKGAPAERVILEPSLAVATVNGALRMKLSWARRQPSVSPTG
jgi:DNA-binding transcriptional regulator YhcF (GntR family)/DNA-binding LacI/PurR family transcriptional regulator